MFESTTSGLERRMDCLTKQGTPHMWNEFVPFFFAEQLLKIIKKCRSFLIRHAREGIIWIFAFQIDYQFCEFVGFSKHSDGIRKSFPADDGRKITMGFTMASESMAFSSVQPILFCPIVEETYIAATIWDLVSKLKPKNETLAVFYPPF